MKAYYINMVYFELGQGSDYVDYGQNQFAGLHHDGNPQMNLAQQQKLKKTSRLPDVSRVLHHNSE